MAQRRERDGLQILASLGKRLAEHKILVDGELVAADDLDAISDFAFQAVDDLARICLEEGLLLVLFDKESKEMVPHNLFPKRPLN